MTNWTQKRVALVTGSLTSERKISFLSGSAMTKALIEVGIIPRVFDFVPSELGSLLAYKPDVVVNAIHGVIGEGGPLQGFLECYEIPYTGSGVLASALAMDKIRAKMIFDQQKIRTPAWNVTSVGKPIPEELSLPLVVKPSLEGSSVGVNFVRKKEEWIDACADSAKGAGELLVEEMILGREIAVTVLNGEVLPSIEITPKKDFYDYEAKYTSHDTIYQVPAPIVSVTQKEINAFAKKAYNIFGCRGVARMDFLVDKNDIPWILEVNTVPGMTATSLVPKAAKAANISFSSLMLMLLEKAQTDSGKTI